MNDWKKDELGKGGREKATSEIGEENPESAVTSRRACIKKRPLSSG